MYQTMLSRYRHYPAPFRVAVLFASLLNTLKSFKICSAIAFDNSDASLQNQNDPFYVPSFRLSDLRSSRAPPHGFSDALGSAGIVAITGMEGAPSLSELRSDALGGLCRCLSDRPDALQGVDGFDSILLAGSKTDRQTVATATAPGGIPLPLPSDDIADACGVVVSEAMEGLRDVVSEVSSAFVDALDALLLARPGAEDLPPILESARGTEYPTVSGIVEDSRHLEHFHLYSKIENSLENGGGVDHHRRQRLNGIDLDVHADAGLFLAFVPALPCGEDLSTSPDGIDESFLVSMPGKGRISLQRAVFPPGSVAVMLGMGAESWLDLGSQQNNDGLRVNLRATRHAVGMRFGERRAWYGMSKSSQGFCLCLLC